VIGSTPESLRDSLKSSAVKSNPKAALQLVSVAILAVAVNKPTLENFAAKPEITDARPIINSSMSISGRVNMTSLTLLGHCLLTTTIISNIKMAVAFQKKMGQDNLWAGNLEAGSLSVKQKEILKDKKEKINKDTAFLLGSGFWKFSGLDKTAYTIEEAVFWGEQVQYANVSPPPSRQSESGMYSVAGPSGRIYKVPVVLAEFYKTAFKKNDVELGSSIESRGILEWNRTYDEVMRKDPNIIAGKGTTVVG
jgi:hypothetical protein